MRVRWMWNGTAAGAAALITASGWSTVVESIGVFGDPGHGAFHQLLDGQDVVGLILLTAIVYLGIAGVLALANSATSMRRAIGRAGLLAIAASIALAGIQIWRNEAPTSPAGRVALVVLYVVGTVAALSLLAPRDWSALRRSLSWVLPVLGWILAAYAITAAHTLRLKPLAEPAALPSSKAPRASGRLAILIFDELDAAYLTGADTQLVETPAFDALARESRAYRGVESPGRSTELSIPSLLTHKRVVGFTPVTRTNARLRFATKDSGDFASAPNFLADAIARGVETAVVGWHIPYCRLLPGLGETGCVWQSLFPVRSALSGSFHVHRSAQEWAARLIPGSRRRAFVRMLRELHRATIAAAADPGFELLFLHYPLPHNPYFYDRSRRRFGLRMTSYEDNVEGADAALAEIMEAMRASGALERTVLIVTSDHPRRVPPPPGASRKIPLLIRIPGDTASRLRDCALDAEHLMTLLSAAASNAPSIDRMRDAIDAWELAANTECEKAA